MTPNQVELVAQAFYASEYSSDWRDAPDILQEEFRDLARMAISLLQQQTSDGRACLAAKPFEAGREAEIARDLCDTRG